jgi:hypothetical protein
MIYFKLFVGMSAAWVHFGTEKKLFLVPVLPAVAGIRAVGAGIKNSGIFANPTSNGFLCFWSLNAILKVINFVDANCNLGIFEFSKLDVFKARTYSRRNLDYKKFFGHR